MPDLLFKGGFNKGIDTVNVRLLLVYFVDENGVHFTYSPHLDLTGYGSSQQEAKNSFAIVLNDFIDYTWKKKTLVKVLKKLGWEIQGRTKRPKKVLAPSITDVIGSNEYVSDIFDQYGTSTYHEEVGIPMQA